MVDSFSFRVAVNKRMKKIFDRLNERDKNVASKQFEYEHECIEDSDEADMSTQFLPKPIMIQKNHSVDKSFRVNNSSTKTKALKIRMKQICQHNFCSKPIIFQKNHSVNCLLSNKAKEPYKEHLSFFLALAMYMNGNSDLDSHTSRYFTEFITKSGYDPKNFRGASIVDLPFVEEIVQRNNFIYDFDIQEGKYVGEQARRMLEDVTKQLNY